MSNRSPEVMVSSMRESLGPSGGWKRGYYGVDKYIKLVNELRTKTREINVIAKTDSLTGLPNRFEMNQVLEAIDKIGQRVWVMMGDIDHFKEVNDINGHSVGDQVLKITAQRLKHHLKMEDCIFRYGGEEFLIIIPAIGQKSKDMKKRAENIRREVSDSDFMVTQNGEKIMLPINISIGVALNQPGEKILNCIDRADQSLYVAKETGRNRVVMSKNS